MTKKRKREPNKIESNRPADGMIGNLENILANKYFPYLFFFSLAFLYFITPFIKNVTFFGAEGGVLAYKRFGWGTPFKNPFAEDAIWQNTYLGGLPGAQGLVDFTRFAVKNVLTMVVSENIEVTIYFILLLSIAGSGMFLFLSKALRMNRIAALVIATAYMFAPANLTLTYAGHISKIGVYALLPFQFYFAEKGLETGKFRYFFYLGGIIAISIGTAHLQYAYLALWAVALFGMFRLISLLRKRISLRSVLMRGLFLGAGALIGLGISARGYVPQFLHASQVSKRAVAAENQEAGKVFAASWSLHPEEIATLVIPEFVGCDLRNEGQQYWGRNPFKINADYFGVIIIFFALGGFLLVKKNAYVRFFLFLFVFSLIYSLGDHTPLFTLGYHYIPGMKFVRGLSFLSLLFVFSAMNLAAFGLHALIENQIPQRQWFRILGIFGGLGALMTVASKPVLSLWNSIVYVDISPEKLQAMNANAGEISKGGAILLVIAIAVLSLIYFFHKKSISPSFFGLSLIALVTVDSWRIDKQFLHYLPADQVKMPSEQKIPAYEFLKEYDTTLYRAFPIHALTTNNLRFSYEGMNLVTGFNDFTLLRYNNILNDHILPGFLQGRLQKGLLDLLNTKYFVHYGEDIKLPGMPSVYNQSNWHIYMNGDAYPYLYFSDSWQVVADTDEIVNLIANGTHDAVKKPLIESEPPAGYSSNADLAPADTLLEADIQFVNQSDYYGGKLSENIFQVRFPRKGLFVFSENYHPSWTAHIDEEEVPVYRVNYLWRGVFVPEGVHTIKFQFVSKAINGSRAVSGISLLLYIGVLGVLAVSKYRMDSRPEQIT